MTRDGWNQLLNYFAQSTRVDEDDDTNVDLLWLFAPDYTQSGKMSQITNVTINGTVVWEQNEQCSGFKISDKD